MNRRVRWGAVLLAAASVGTVLLAFRVLYGHWSPTPILFKSALDPGYLRRLRPDHAVQVVYAFASNPMHLATAAIGLSGAWLLGRDVAVARAAVAGPARDRDLRVLPAVGDQPAVFADAVLGGAEVAGRSWWCWSRRCWRGTTRWNCGR